MEEKSLVKIENGIFSKIKLFFRNIFNKNKSGESVEKLTNLNNNDMEENEMSDSLQNLVQNELSEEMKERIEEENIESLINEVGTSKDELMKLDIETLRKIDNQYVKKLDNVNSKIANLKAKLSTN